MFVCFVIFEGCIIIRKPSKWKNSYKKYNFRIKIGMNKSYIKSILLRMETIVIVMPIQRFSLKHHIMEN